MSRLIFRYKLLKLFDCENNNNNYLLSESEIFMGKSQTETLQY